MKVHDRVIQASIEEPLAYDEGIILAIIGPKILVFWWLSGDTIAYREGELLYLDGESKLEQPHTQA